MPILFLFLFLFVLVPTIYAQQIQSEDILKLTGNITNQLNKIGDKAKAKYAENIDNPYIPAKINSEYTLEKTKENLRLAFRKYVNYYFASKVPAYRNLNSNITFKKIDNPKVTDDYMFFTADKVKNSNDTVFIRYKDIVNRQIIYYVKIADNGFYTPYVKMGEHLITCGGKEMADYIFYMQHQYALKFYQNDLENFKTLAAKYQTMIEKPEVSEEQRKLIIQGNTMNEKMYYDEAINYYDKAIAVNPVSSPNSYYNYALIAAVAEKYELAILNMKKYLLLMPNAEDARAAQDKIYEWETFTK
jgi:tetratricopeptide (TPR) repeat protein